MKKSEKSSETNSLKFHNLSCFKQILLKTMLILLQSLDKNRKIFYLPKIGAINLPYF